MSIQIGGGVVQLSNQKVSITIRNCIFKSGAFSALTNNGAALLELPDNYAPGVIEILIDGEKLERPVSKDDIIECLGNRTGRIRLGFCRICGVPAAYEEDMVTWYHPDTGENIVKCILEA